MDLIYLINCALRDRVPEGVRSMDLPALFRLAQAHGLTALVSQALALAGPIPAYWKEAGEKAVRKQILLDLEYRELTAFLEAERLWYLPLKGLVLEPLYPKAGQRQMADCDILVDPAGRDRVAQWFLHRGYTPEQDQGWGHDAFTKKPIYHFEIHQSLFAPCHGETFYHYYRNVSDRLVATSPYGRQFSPEDLYLYLLAHGYKHFECQGIGLRFLLDLYLFLSQTPLDRSYLEGELARLGLGTFEARCRDLAEACFTDQTLTKEQEGLLRYFVESGAYGTADHGLTRPLRDRTLAGEKVTPWVKGRYLLGRIFPGREALETWGQVRYPEKRLPWVLLFLLRIPWAWRERRRISREVRSLHRMKDL